MSPLLHRNDKNLTYKLEVDPSILVGRGLAPAGEGSDKNLPCVKGVTLAKRDGGIVLSAGASPRPTTDDRRQIQIILPYPDIGYQKKRLNCYAVVGADSISARMKLPL